MQANPVKFSEEQPVASVAAPTRRDRLPRRMWEILADQPHRDRAPYRLFAPVPRGACAGSPDLAPERTAMGGAR